MNIRLLIFQPEKFLLSCCWFLLACASFPTRFFWILCSRAKNFVGSLASRRNFLESRWFFPGNQSENRFSRLRQNPEDRKNSALCKFQPIKCWWFPALWFCFPWINSANRWCWLFAYFLRLKTDMQKPCQLPKNRWILKKQQNPTSFNKKTAKTNRIQQKTTK